MPRLSVVVPVYNVEDYVDECLASLEAQEFRDFEAVCVNDGSTDSSRDILARWANDHEWIRVVDKRNGGLSSARNAGIQSATGEYVCFLDSDDRLLPHACGRIVEAFEASSASVVVYGGYALPRDATWQWLEYALTPDPASYIGFSDDLVFSEKTRPFAWRTAARREFLLGASATEVLFNNDVRYGEDQVFQFLAYAVSPKTEVIADRLYEYRVNRTGSLMSGALTDMADMLCSHVDIMAYVLSDYAQLGILSACEAPMLRWLSRFIAHDALILDDDACGRVLERLGTLLCAYWEPSHVRNMHLPKSVKTSLLDAMSNTPPKGVRRKALQRVLHKDLFWHGSPLRHLLAKVRTRQ